MTKYYVHIGRKFFLRAPVGLYKAWGRKDRKTAIRFNDGGFVVIKPIRRTR